MHYMVVQFWLSINPLSAERCEDLFFSAHAERLLFSAKLPWRRGVPGEIGAECSDVVGKCSGSDDALLRRLGARKDLERVILLHRQHLSRERHHHAWCR